MSLTPLTRSNLANLLGRTWFDSWDFPSRINDQHFGTVLFENDLYPHTFYRGFKVRPRTLAAIESSGQSEVNNDKDKFQVKLSVDHFKMEEIEVKVVDDSIVIHGKHEEKGDEHGFIAREFTRRYLLPEAIEPDDITASFNADGLLVVEAPKKEIEALPPNEVVVPIAVSTNPAE